MALVVLMIAAGIARVAFVRGAASTASRLRLVACSGLAGAALRDVRRRPPATSAIIPAVLLLPPARCWSRWPRHGSGATPAPARSARAWLPYNGVVAVEVPLVAQSSGR